MPEFAGILSSGMIIVVGLIFGVLPMLAFPYLALRFRDSRAEMPDPELGIKAGYYFLFSLAAMLILFGLTMSAVDVLNGTFDGNEAKKKADDNGPFAPPRGQPKEPAKKEFWSIPQRIAAGMVISGAIFAILMFLLIKLGTNDSNYPAARRTFVGARLTIAGLIIMVALTALMIVLFQKKAQVPEEVLNRIYEVIIAVMIVWSPTFILHMVLMRAYSNKPYHSATAVDHPERDDRERERERPRRPYDD